MTSTIDDAAFSYEGSWSHDEDGSSNLIDGTQSWTNDPTATFSFSFQGTGFDFCAGLKADRGPFTYEIDGSSQGAGTQLGDSDERDPVCQTVASVRNLARGNHRVVFRNGGNSYFAADAVTIFDEPAVPNRASTQSSTTSQSSTTTTSPQTTSTTPSSSSTSTSSSEALFPFGLSSSSSFSSSLRSSSSTASTSASAVPANSPAQHSGMSSGQKAALVGGPIIGGIALAVLAFFLYTRCKRKREAHSVSIAPSASTHYLDEKDDGKGFFGPTDRSFSPMQFAGRISPISFPKRGHNRLNSEMSLESHTEPFRPTSLGPQPPHVEPFHLPAGDFVNYRNSHMDPTQPPAVLQRQSSYDDRLAAASASLPTWRDSKLSETSRYPSTVYQKTEVEPDRLSTYSALYEGLMEDNSSQEEHVATGRDKYRSS